MPVLLVTGTGRWFITRMGFRDTRPGFASVAAMLKLALLLFVFGLGPMALMVVAGLKPGRDGPIVFMLLGVPLLASWGGAFFIAWAAVIRWLFLPKPKTY